jgi:hypothetical protein
MTLDQDTLDQTRGWELPRRPLVPPVDLPDHPDPLAINGRWTSAMLDVFRLWRPSAIYVCGFAAPLRAEFALEGRDTVARYGHGNMRSVPVFVGTSKARTGLAAEKLDTMPWPEAQVVLLARVWLQSQAHADQVAADVHKHLADLVEEQDEAALRHSWYEVRRLGVRGVVDWIERAAGEKRYACWDEAGLAVMCDDVAKAAAARAMPLASALDMALGRVVHVPHNGGRVM